MYIGLSILLVSLQFKFDHKGFISVKEAVPNKHYRDCLKYACITVRPWNTGWSILYFS